MLDYAILGSLEVRIDGLIAPITGFRQRALLAMLLLHANEVVSSDRLLEELWGAEPRADTAVLRVRVSQLRKALDQRGGGRPIETRAPGYILSLEREQLDLGRFERLAEEGSAALGHDAAAAAASFRDALALWRGTPLAEFEYELFAQSAIGRLEELRLTTLEKRIDAELALGLERDLIGELRTLVAEHPLRERFCEQLMLALYRAGRQVEALDVFHERRRIMVEELAIEPGPSLQLLQRRILAQEATLQRSRESHPSGSPAAGAPRPLPVETRKTVSVLVCDVVEATSGDARPDAEVMRLVRERYTEVCSTVIARHSGTVERFIGDAVMGVFGVPVTHEDDALRAARAAVELRQELSQLNAELGTARGVTLAARLGVDTGEVLTQDFASGGASVTGDVVHLASRLQQAANEGEILVGETAWSLVRDAIKAEFATMLEASAGTTGAIVAWRLLALDENAPPIPRRFDTPFVGRAHELAQLRSIYERTSRERVPCLYTVIGEAGIGKSRLAEEARVDLLAEARVLVGRCPPYGEGVTYAALDEITSQALGDGRETALSVLLAGEPDGQRVAEAVGGLLGSTTTSLVLEEAFWGVRRLCETLAAPRPLVLVFEDVHWAEPSMLDLIEYLAAHVRACPLLLLCLARRELLERRPGWGRRTGHSAMLSLGPLRRGDSQVLATWLTRERDAHDAADDVVATAQGNPLFVEQLVTMLADGGWTTAERPVPATVEALLVARLELLGPVERLALERASVLGPRFDVPALALLVPADVRAALPAHLRALVRRRLLSRARFVGGADGYRFRHVLVREAAYRRLPKEQRAELHERYAGALEAAREAAPAGGVPGGRDEPIAYHLERAYDYHVQLGRDDAHARRLASGATKHLVAAAADAFARTDFRAADQLLARAIALMPSDDARRAAALYDRGTSLLTLGRFAEADAVLVQTIEAAVALGDERSEWRARLDRALSGTDASTMHASAALARGGVKALGALGDERGLVRAWRLAGAVARARGRAARMQHAAEQMLDHARRSGVYREEAWALWFLADALLIGPTPVPAGIRTCRRLLRTGRELRVGDVGLFGTLANLQAMQGAFDEGRELLARGRELMEALGHRKPLLSTICWRGELELLAGDEAAAEVALGEAQELAAACDDPQTGAVISALRARGMLLAGDPGAEAEGLIRAARDGASPTSRPAQAQWRSVHAAFLAAHGAADAAVEQASAAARLLRATDLLSLQGDVHVDLAAALLARGDAEQAARAVDRARTFYETKGNRVAAGRITTASALSLG